VRLQRLASQRLDHVRPSRAAAAAAIAHALILCKQVELCAQFRPPQLLSSSCLLHHFEQERAPSIACHPRKAGHVPAAAAWRRRR
jgi:hypothetical protein